jgi:hypothetical protein
MDTPQPTAPEIAQPIADPTVTDKEKTSPKVSLGAIIGLGAIVIIAISYFAVVPAIQVSEYKKSASSQTAVNDKMLRVYDNFKSSVFTKTDTKAASDKVDIDSGQDAVKDAQAALDSNEKSLTKFHALPLLAWNKKYKAAEDTDTNEIAYIQKSRNFLQNYTALLTYSQKENVLSQKVETIDTDMESLKSATTPAAVATSIDTIVTKLQPLVDEDRTIIPPTYLQASHTAELASITDLVDSLKGMSAAVRALDLTKITTYSNKVDKAVTDATKQEEQFITDLHQKSTIAVEMIELRLLNDKIFKGYASL